MIFWRQWRLLLRHAASRRKAECPLDEAIVRCQDIPPTTPYKRTSEGMDVIAEIKVRSPAEGKLASGVTVESIVARAKGYVTAGASILSVLTEPEKFEGSLDYLSAVKAQVGKSVGRHEKGLSR